MQGTLLDGKKMVIDWDAGFIEGRQYKRSTKVIFFYSNHIIFFRT